MKQHKEICQCRAQFVEETEVMVVKRERKERSRAQNEENGGHFCKEANEVPPGEGTGSVEEEDINRETARRFFSVCAEITLQPASKRGKMEVEHINRVVSDSDSDVGKLRRLVKRTSYSKRKQDESRDDQLAGESFTEKSSKSGISSTVTGALLYRKDALAVSK